MMSSERVILFKLASLNNNPVSLEENHLRFLALEHTWGICCGASHIFAAVVVWKPLAGLALAMDALGYIIPFRALKRTDWSV